MHTSTCCQLMIHIPKSALGARRVLANLSTVLCSYIGASMIQQALVSMWDQQLSIDKGPLHLGRTSHSGAQLDAE